MSASWEALRRTCELADSTPPAEAIKTFSLGLGRHVLGDAHGFWLEPESQDGHCDPSRFVFHIGQRIAALHQAYNGNPTQSPIEDMMLGALLWLDADWVGFPEYDEYGGPADLADEPTDPKFYITTQAPIAGYRADFLLWFSFGRVRLGLVVECDGHAFHEKTKEQASNDKKRDRAMLAVGYPVMRFSGADVFKDALGCADQVRDVLLPMLERIHREVLGRS